MVVGETYEKFFERSEKALYKYQNYFQTMQVSKQGGTMGVVLIQYHTIFIQYHPSNF